MLSTRLFLSLQFSVPTGSFVYNFQAYCILSSIMHLGKVLLEGSDGTDSQYSSLWAAYVWVMPWGLQSLWAGLYRIGPANIQPYRKLLYDVLFVL